MGLWEFCFHRFRYPNYQFDKLFDGCHYVFSREYYVIWEWLLPGKTVRVLEIILKKLIPTFSFVETILTGWLMAVQTFITLGLMFSCSAQIVTAMIVVRWPLNFVFRYQWQLLGGCSVLNAVTSLMLMLGVAVFGGQCWRRDWLLYPNFHHLSWSFALAVVALILGIFASGCFYLVST